MSVRVLRGDCRNVLRSLEAESVHCVVTSPPYWGLRDYKIGADALGLERDYRLYIEHLVEIMREVRRVLRKDGTLWLVIGDSYATGAGKVGERPGGGAQGDNWQGEMTQANRMPQPGLKPKDLCGIPWRVAFALQDDGWWLRSDVIWSKPNPMPESIRDRPTKAHEYIFLLTKAERYFYDTDAIREPTLSLDPEHSSYRPNSAIIADEGRKEYSAKHEMSARVYDPAGRNKRSVWTVTTCPFPEAHFATFPPALIEPCILAGTSEKGCCAKCGAPWMRETERIDKGWDGSKYGESALAATGGAKDGGTARSTLGSGNGRLVGQNETIGWSPSCACCVTGTVPCTVLDPFAGAGTTGLVADRHGRDAILIELNDDYAEMAERRIRADAGMFAKVAAE